MTRLLFIRHGATAGNLQRRYIGRTDQPLCPEGIAQAKALTALSLAPDRVFCSPLLRTRQTAQLAFPGLEPEIVPGFTETDFGPWEGKTADELADCAAYRDWVDGFCQGPIPGGEDPAAFKIRCRQAFLEIVPRLPADGCAAFVVTALSPGRCTVTAQADGESVSMDFLVPDTSLTVAEASMDRQFSAWLGGTPTAGGAALKGRIAFALTGYEDDFATYTVTLTTDGEVQSPVRLARLTLQAGGEVREVGVLTVDPEHDGDGAEHTFQVQVPRGMAGTLNVTGI